MPNRCGRSSEDSDHKFCVLVASLGRMLIQRAEKAAGVRVSAGAAEALAAMAASAAECSSQEVWVHMCRLFFELRRCGAPPLGEHDRRGLQSVSDLGFSLAVGRLGGPVAAEYDGGAAELAFGVMVSLEEES